MKLNTSTAKFEELHRLAEGRGKARKIDHQDLRNILMDHSVMVARLQQFGITFEEVEQ